MTERFDKLTKLTPCASITTNSTRAELKPCPFCGGGDAKTHYCQTVSPAVVAACICGGQGPADFTKEGAIKAWNTRAPDPREDDYRKKPEALNHSCVRDDILVMRENGRIEPFYNKQRDDLLREALGLIWRVSDELTTVDYTDAILLIGQARALGFETGGV